MPNRKINKSYKLTPRALLIAAALTAAAFGVYLYFSHAAVASCATGVVQMSAGDTCSVQAVGQYEFGYKSSGPSSHFVTYNGATVSSGHDISPTSGCWKGTADMKSGTYVFTVQTGTMLVRGGSCDTGIAASGRLTCAVISPISIRWNMSWQNAKSGNVVLMRGGNVIYRAGGAPSGSAVYSEKNLAPNTYTASLRDGVGGPLLAGASCRT